MDALTKASRPKTMNLWTMIFLLLAAIASAADGPVVKLHLDLAQTHPVSSNLYGIFFEEVN